MSSLPLSLDQHIPEQLLSKMLKQMVPAGADDADLYIQHSVSESLALEEGRVKHVSASTAQGIGARVICGEASGHAYTDSFDAAALLDTAQAARAIASSGQDLSPQAIRTQALKHLLYAASAIGVKS